jgi:sugar O-acyltransferase (sialic acid O-acetyltransferase NeuD family)
MKKVVIFGSGYFAQVVYVYLSRDSAYEVAGFTVNQKYLTQKKVMGLEVVPFEGIEDVYPPDQYPMFIAISFGRLNKARSEIYKICRDKGYTLISYVSSKAAQWGEIEVGDNCLILENSVIQPFVRIGNDVIIWSGAFIGHHSKIEDHCFIAAHAVISGHVMVGSHCFVGVNATIRDEVTVAPECIIGAGALIMKDTKEHEVYAGKAIDPVVVPNPELRSYLLTGHRKLR